MRTAFFAAAIALTFPATAQQMDHSGHQMQPEPEESAEDHSHHGHVEDAQSVEEADSHAGHDMSAVTAQDDPPTDPHAGHDMGEMEMSEMTATPFPQSGPPSDAFSGPEHAADALFSEAEMAAAREQLRKEQGGAIHSLFSVDRLELQAGEGADIYAWEANAWIGGDLNKLWLKTEGEGEFSGSLEDAEVQALWSRAIGPWFDLQAGVRYDHRPSGPDISHLALGVQGLAPYFFEVDVAGFLSDAGDFTARAEAEYDLRINQQLILQPRVELNLSAQDIPELNIGSGLTSVDAGLRLRYEIVPEFAPYIGVEYQTDLGATRNFTQADGGDPDRAAFLAGVKFWF